MLEQLIVIGASTPTIIRVVDDLNQAVDRKLGIVGFLDNASASLGKEFFGFPILGGFEAIEAFRPDQVALINTISTPSPDRLQTVSRRPSTFWRAAIASSTSCIQASIPDMSR